MMPSEHGIGMTSQRTRERLLDQIREAGVTDEKVLSRILEVPRHWFVDEALASRAYENTALPIGANQTISQPYTVARMTELLLQGEYLENVLEVGTGSGYQTAVLSPFVRRVYTVERIESLLIQARSRFHKLRLMNIRTRHTDGGMGWPDYAPFDGIIVTAAPQGIPLALVDQLKIGARMILPIGSKDEQALVLVTKTEEGHEKQIIERASFVPLLKDRV